MFRMCARDCHSYTYLNPSFGYRLKANGMGLLLHQTAAHMSLGGLVPTRHGRGAGEASMGTKVARLLEEVEAMRAADPTSKCVAFSQVTVRPP